MITLASMKLRIRENTLRIRITQSELEVICTGDELKSSIHFPNGAQLSYSLFPSKNQDTQVVFEDCSIIVHLSPTDIETLSDDANVGIQSIYNTDNGFLDLLIEKDFTCLHPRGIEDNDTFPNPNKKDMA